MSPVWLSLLGGNLQSPWMWTKRHGGARASRCGPGGIGGGIPWTAPSGLGSGPLDVDHKVSESRTPGCGLEEWGSRTPVCVLGDVGALGALDVDQETLGVHGPWMCWLCRSLCSSLNCSTVWSFTSGFEIWSRMLSVDQLSSPENISVRIRATTGTTCEPEPQHEMSKGSQVLLKVLNIVIPAGGYELWSCNYLI